MKWALEFNNTINININCNYKKEKDYNKVIEVSYMDHGPSIQCLNHCAHSHQRKKLWTKLANLKNHIDHVLVLSDFKKFE